MATELKAVPDRKVESNDVRELLNTPGTLMGSFEVARELGVRPSNLQFVKGLPKPVVNYLLRGRLWLGEDIRSFAQDRKGRRTSRLDDKDALAS